LLRFLRPHELNDIKKLISSFRRPAEPLVSTP
jgi:hypothetical protein